MDNDVQPEIAALNREMQVRRLHTLVLAVFCNIYFLIIVWQAVPKQSSLWMIIVIPTMLCAVATIEFIEGKQSLTLGFYNFVLAVSSISLLLGAIYPFFF